MVPEKLPYSRLYCRKRKVHVECGQRVPEQGCGSLMNIGKADPTRPMFAHSMPVYYART